MVSSSHFQKKGKKSTAEHLFVYSLYLAKSCYSDWKAAPANKLHYWTIFLEVRLESIDCLTGALQGLSVCSPNLLLSGI
jgi:hypothetical protein